MATKKQKVTLNRDLLDELLEAAIESGRAAALLEDRASTRDYKTPFAVLESDSETANKKFGDLYARCMKKAETIQPNDPESSPCSHSYVNPHMAASIQDKLDEIGRMIRNDRNDLGA